MAYTRFRNGLDITTAAAVDKRIYLTKAEMLAAEDNFNLPAVYFAVCPDDGKLYLYNVNNVASAETGKFKRIESTINFEKPSTEESKANFNEAIVESAAVTETKTEVEELKATVDNLVLDGGEVQASYNLTGNLKNVSADPSNIALVDYNGSASLRFVTNTNFKLPDTILVNNKSVQKGNIGFISCNGCKVRWSYETAGLLELESVTNTVYYTIEGVVSEG